MNIFEITIQRKAGDGWPVVVEQSKPGSFLPVRKEDTMYLDEEAQDELISLGELKPLAYGTLLGQALFSGKVYRAFTDALAQAREGDHLRVLLSIEDPTLQSYRWGRLCAPMDDDEWDFLALNQQVPFSLYLPSSTDRRFPAIGQRDLRALVLVANPEGLADRGMADFDAAATVASVRKALGEIPCDVLANVEGAKGLPTLDQLCERITAEHYTLLHVVAHGQVKNKRTLIYLADEQNQLDRITSDELITELRRLHGAKGLPHFAFLCTCESAKPTDEGALGGLAQQLVQKLGMPAVLAMTEKVTIPTAEALAERFYLQLRQHGEVDRALVEACAGLTRRRDINVPVLYSRLGGWPLFSDTEDRDLTDKEIEFGLDELAKLMPERAPILEEEFTTQAAKLRGKLGADRDKLSKAAQKEWDETLIEVNALCEEVLDLNFRALALVQKPPAYDNRCPFRGLYPFRAEDREFFFGRETLVGELVNRLQQHSFLAMLGSSGCGKSSVVLAGLIPALQAKEPRGQLAYLTPGSDPLAQLEAALAKVGDQPAVVVVDQFEELFTLCHDAAQRRAFLDRLLALPQDLTGFGNLSGLKVILTMRADFWGECAPYQALKEAMQANQELIAPMNVAELRSAMDQQAAAVGLRFEADLANTILDAVKDEPGAMPLLQHALLELWRRRHGRWLLAKEYREGVGGIKEAIARTADELYKKLSPTEQELMRIILVRLTQPGVEISPEKEYRDTRERMAMAQLIPADEDRALVRKLVNQLADARLVVTSGSGDADETEVEVAHEALIRHWPRLRGWLREDRIALRLWKDIIRDAQEWDDAGRPDNLLPRWNSKLEAAVGLRHHPRFELGQLERAYLDACEELQDREMAEKERRARELEEALTRAERQARIAQAGQLAAQTQMVLDRQEDPSGSLALLLAQEAVLATLGPDQEVTREAAAALRQAVNQAPPWRIALPRIGHIRPIYAAAFSPDGRMVVTASRDHTACLWDAETEEQLRRLSGHRYRITDAAFSHDGKMLVTTSYDETALLWDVNTGDEIRRFEGHLWGVNGVAFSPDSRMIATVSGDNTARLWDVATGREIRCFEGHEYGLESAAFSPDGQTLVTASWDNTARLWDVETGKEIHRLRCEGAVFSAHFSPNGQTVVTAGEDKTACLWNAATGKLIREFRGHGKRVSDAVFSPDGRTICTTSYDCTARLWDVETGETLRQFQGHSWGVNTADFSRDGQTILTSSGDNTARLWRVEKGEEFRRLVAHPHGINAAVFSPDECSLAIAGRDNHVYLWDVKTSKEILHLTGHVGMTFDIAFSPDGRLLVTSGSDNTARLWDVRTGQERHRLEGHEAAVFSAAFSRDGKTLVTASLDNTARLWDVRTGQERHRLEGHEAAVFSAAFSPDGKMLVTASQDETARLWDATTGREDRSYRQFTEHRGSINAVAFSPDGQTVVTASADGTVRFWDVRKRKEIRRIEGHSSAVNAVAFSPSGQSLVTASRDETAHLWDAETGRKTFSLLGHTAPVLAAAFSSDGRMVVTTDQDNTARVWDAQTGQETYRITGEGPEIVAAIASRGEQAMATTDDEEAAHSLSGIKRLLALAETLIRRDPPVLCSEERRRFGINLE